MKKIRSSKKGFTLAELLIVVAIIGVLVGISIPIFSAQLKKSRIATNQANARACYAAAKAAYLDDSTVLAGTYDVATGAYDPSGTACSTDIADSEGINTWAKDTTISDKIDDKVATAWSITLDADGNVTAMKATFPA